MTKDDMIAKLREHFKGHDYFKAGPTVSIPDADPHFHVSVEIPNHNHTSCVCRNATVWLDEGFAIVNETGEEINLMEDIA